MKIEKLLKKLKEKRNSIVIMLAEDESIYNPQVLVMLVHELRSLTSMINMITGDDMKGGREE